jgi:hypothetical protein
MKTLRYLALLALAPVASAQVSVSASQIKDAFNRPVAAAKLCFVPVDATKTPTGFRVGSEQVVPSEVCGTVTAGVLQTGLTVAANVSGTFYHVYLKQAFSNTVIRDYGMTPITTTWTLDTYDASLAVLPVAAITAGTTTTIPSTSPASCNITGTGPFLLNCAVPQGIQGPIGAPTSGVNLSTTTAQAMAGPLTQATSVVLASATDLNTVVACGSYYIFGGAPINGPSALGGNFKLRVECANGSGFATQIAYDLVSGTNNSYIRNESFGTWHLWQLVSPPIGTGRDQWGTTGPCSITAAGGGATGGAFHSGTTGTCTFNVIMGDSLLAPTVWACYGSDIDHPAGLITLTGGTATTAILSVPTTAGDEVVFHCDPN